MVAAAQIPLPLYPRTQPGVRLEWWKHGGGQELRLGDLPAHSEIVVSFRRTAGGVLTLSHGDGERWTATETEGERGERTEYRFRHDASRLRLRWSAPVSEVAVLGETDTKTIDLARRPAKRGQRRAIVFGGTEGLPSHGFVLFEREDPAARRTTVRGFGFYPDPEAGFLRLITLSRIPGFVGDELLNRKFSRIQQQLVVYVDSEQFDAADLAVARWQCRGVYRLLIQDCVGFTRDVAAAVGLETPPRGLAGMRPSDYIRRLIEAN